MTTPNSISTIHDESVHAAQREALRRELLQRIVKNEAQRRDGRKASEK